MSTNHRNSLDSLYVNGDNVTYFDSFGVEHIPKEIKKFLGNKNITTNVNRIQEFDSIMCGYFYIRFIGFIFKGKSLFYYNNLFSPNEYEKSNKIIRKYFQFLKTKNCQFFIKVLSKLDCSLC